MVRMTLREAAAAGLLMAVQVQAQASIITTVTEQVSTVLTLIPLATVEDFITYEADSCTRSANGSASLTTVTSTVTACPQSVQNCPYGQLTTAVVPCYASPVFAPISFSSSVYTITTCGADVPKCPYLSTSYVPCSPTQTGTSYATAAPAPANGGSAASAAAAAPAGGASAAAAPAGGSTSGSSPASGPAAAPAAAPAGGSGSSTAKSSPAVVTAGAASFGGNAAAAFGGLFALFAMF